MHSSWGGTVDSDCGENQKLHYKCNYTNIVQGSVLSSKVNDNGITYSTVSTLAIVNKGKTCDLQTYYGNNITMAQDSLLPQNILVTVNYDNHHTCKYDPFVIDNKTDAIITYVGIAIISLGLLVSTCICMCLGCAYKR